MPNKRNKKRNKSSDKPPEDKPATKKPVNKPANKPAEKPAEKLPDKSNKNTLLTDDSNYKDTLQTYLHYMQQLGPQREWMKHKFGMRLRDMFAVKKDIKVLAVGTGTGEVDIDFLNEIVRCGKEVCGDGYSVVYQVIEPNPASVDFFRSVVTKNENYKNIKFQWFVGFFDKFVEQFHKKQQEANKFDFAHFVRVFYHIDSVSVLTTMYKHLLVKNGIVAAVGENENAFWPKMMNFLADHKMEHECFTCSGPVSQAYFLPGWLTQARQNDWKYESYVHGYNFDVTSMYDENSKDGNYLMDFALHAKDARKTVQKDIVDDFLKFIDENKYEKEIIENGAVVAKKYFKCELGAIMITKE